jgi:hypothetical protein
LIRPGVEPEIDAAREMRDWAWAQIEHHSAGAGVPAASIAIVLLGRDRHGRHHATVNSWSPLAEDTSRLQVCAAAAALLQQRALE